jgi:hypothetical protein
MSEEIIRPAPPEPLDPLPWEDLGSRPAGPALRRSLGELLAHPARFYRRMATTGGLHEPMTFFAVVLVAAVLLAFPATLSFHAVAAPAPEEVAAEVSAAYALPARLSGLLLVLLPLTAVAGCLAATLLGGLFHAGAKLFGAHNYEGSLSVWFYTLSAALVPLTLALSVLLVVSLGGYLLGVPWPALRESAAPFARWTALVLGSAALLAASVLVVVHCVVGCTQAFGLDAMLGAAAAVAGLLAAGGAAGLCAWSLRARGPALGLAVTGLVVALGAAVAAGGLIASHRAEGGA